jgi:hypothetical protein
MSNTDPLELEGLRLLTPMAELLALCKARGWDNNASPGAGVATIATTATFRLDEPVQSALCSFDDDVLVQIQITYEQPEQKRIEAGLAAFPHRTHVDLIEMWGAFSADHQVARFGKDDWTSLTTVHVGRLANRDEVKRIFATFGGGLEPPPHV